MLVFIILSLGGGEWVRRDVNERRFRINSGCIVGIFLLQKSALQVDLLLDASKRLTLDRLPGR